MSGKGSISHDYLVLDTILLIFIMLLITACTWQPPLVLPKIDLSSFMNKIFDTFLQIVVIAFGFILLDVWWSRKEERRKSLPFEEFLLSQIEYIGRLAHESRQKIELVHTENTTEWITQRDELIKQNISRLDTISKTVASILGENKSLSISTVTGFTNFLSSIAPIIQELVECNKREIQVQIDVLKVLFSNLGKKAEEIGNYLREARNVPN